MTPRKWNGLLLFLIGIVLAYIPDPLSKSMAGSPPLLLAFIHLASPLGVIVLLIGIYRFSTIEKAKKK